MQQKNAYFISYNSEDADRVAEIARELNRHGIPLWYDYGLSHCGSDWDEQIADHVESCKAVIMFITKNVFLKPKSYVEMEYQMATDHFDKNVYIVMLDYIDKKSIPNKYVRWWINLTHQHWITPPTAKEIIRVIATDPGDNEMTADELCNKGISYYKGLNGVEKDFEKAVDFFQRSCKMGYSKAQYYLGVCRYNGTGIEKNINEAVCLYKLAAESGNANAQNNLGLCYLYGNGVKKDYAKAIAYLQAAADEQNSWALFTLGSCYEKGMGVEKNLDEALKNYRKASSHGNERAKDAVRRLTK